MRVLLLMEGEKANSLACVQTQVEGDVLRGQKPNENTISTARAELCEREPDHPQFLIEKINNKSNLFVRGYLFFQEI